jgi:REP element-mobilizing transposase RayT
VQPQLHAYLAVVLQDHSCPSLQVGGVEDHVHLLFNLSRTINIAKLVHTLKVSSSKWLKAQRMTAMDFHWQKGYGVFSVSQRNVHAAVSYIRDQRKHHRTIGFEEEYRRLLDLNEIVYDERYVWE